VSEENKEICRRLYGEMISEGRFDVLEELLQADVIEHEELPGDAEGRDGVREVFEMMRGAFPDLRAEVSQMIAEGDRVVAHATFSGTQRGEFMGVPASGRRVEVEVIDIFRIAGGKVAEHWGVMDQMTMMEQLGALGDESMPLGD
jgi:steroid delta-isomerase-like uncharacterized protein